MRPEEYALWNVARQVSHQTGVLYFDGREIAKLFKGTAKDRIYRAAKGLIKMGWLEVIAAAARDKRTGLYSCTQYRVLSAEEWLTKHPHTCVSSLETGTGTSPQSATGNQSSKRERPVPITRMTSPQNATYSDKENLDKEIVRESPVPETGLDETATSSLSRDEVEGVEANCKAIGVHLALNGWPTTRQTEQIVRDYLKEGQSKELIVKAIGATMENKPMRERQPGLYLAQNLKANVDLLVAEARGQVQRKRDDYPSLDIESLRPSPAPALVPAPAPVPRGGMTEAEYEAEFGERMRALCRQLGLPRAELPTLAMPER